MKKTLFFVLVTFSSTATYCQKSTPVLGMAESDFLKKNKADLVEAHDSIAIYKIAQSPAWHFKPKTRFYYFRTGKLVEINEGRREPDIIVEKRDR